MANNDVEKPRVQRNNPLRAIIGVAKDWEQWEGLWVYNQASRMRYEEKAHDLNKFTEMFRGNINEPYSFEGLAAKVSEFTEKWTGNSLLG